MSAESRVETDYLEFTVARKGAIPRVGRPRLGTPAGGACSGLGVILPAYRKATGPDGSTFEITEDCNEARGLDRSTYDLGLAGGGGLEIKLLDTLGMSFGLLYTYGLLDLDKSDSDFMKQRALTLRAGLVYSIG